MLFPFLLISLPLAFASEIHSLHHSRDHSHHVNKRLPGTWYHARDHPVHDLFKRADDGIEYASVGSPSSCIFLSASRLVYDEYNFI